MAAICRIVALGGLGEVGKNMTAYECDGSIVVVDAGLAFPRDEHLGVDLVLPDFSYLRERADSIKAVILTHGHEDHVGSLPYLMREVPIPEVWATRLTLGLVKSKLDEHGLLRAAELREVHPDDPPRDPEGSELARRVVGMHLAQLRRAQESVLVELRLDQPERQPRRPDLGNRYLPHQVRERADVILVAVREDHGLDGIGSLAQGREVRQNEIDAEVLVPRKGEAGVHDDDGAVALVGGHVLPDLAKAAEGDNPADSSHSSPV